MYIWHYAIINSIITMSLMLVTDWVDTFRVPCKMTAIMLFRYFALMSFESIDAHLLVEEDDAL